MTNAELQSFLETALPTVEFTVSGDGRHFDIMASGAEFAHLSRLQQQKKLNKILEPFLKSGEVHAVNYTISS